LRAYRIALAVCVSAWCGWLVVGGLASGQSDVIWAVAAGLVVGCISFVGVSLGWERPSRREARLLFGGFLLEVVVIVPLLFSDLAPRAFAGAYMLCFVGFVVHASAAGRTIGLTARFTGRSPLNPHDAYLKQRAAAERSLDITGRPPLITSFPIPQSDQLALMAVADDLRRARRRFRAGPTTRGRLLFLGDDLVGKGFLGASIAYRADSSFLRIEGADRDPDRNARAAFTEAFSSARQGRCGVVMMSGGSLFDQDEALRLASAIDPVDWPLILICAATESGDLELAITSRLDRTIRLDTPK
jgi:hypothetical protein